MTGWASYDTHLRHLQGASQAPANEFLDRIIPWLDTYPRPKDVVVVCEPYIITVNTAKVSPGDEHWSIEQAGVLRHHSRWAGIEFVDKHSASNAKKFVSNERLRAIGWWQPGKGHANDALRQVLVHIAERDQEVLSHLLSGTV